MSGEGTPQGVSKPVKITLLDRAASAARFTGGIAQAAYYTLKAWFDFL
ncbi:hypothetical protein ACIQJ4_35845 [Streptomyces filamentosus]